jgi:hypothetical protein
VYEIEIVNHQIEHNRHIGSTWVERRQPIALNEPRTVDERHRGAHGAIETLHVTDLQHHTGRLRERNQFVRFRQGYGERLLDEDVLAGTQCARRDREVRGRRHHDRHGIDEFEQGVEGSVRRRTELARHLRRTRRILVNEPDEAIPRQVAKDSHVMDTEPTGTDDTDPWSA